MENINFIVIKVCIVECFLSMCFYEYVEILGYNIECISYCRSRYEPGRSLTPTRVCHRSEGKRKENVLKGIENGRLKTITGSVSWGRRRCRCRPAVEPYGLPKGGWCGGHKGWARSTRSSPEEIDAQLQAEKQKARKKRNKRRRWR